MINLSRTAVMAVAIVAGVLAIDPQDSILNLVGFAWAGFGSAFGPLVLLTLYWKRLNFAGAISGMVTGAVVSFAWGMSPLGDSLYEIVPGFFSGLFVMVVVSLATPAPPASVRSAFDRATKLTKVSQAHPELEVSEVQEKLL